MEVIFAFGDIHSDRCNVSLLVWDGFRIPVLMKQIIYALRVLGLHKVLVHFVNGFKILGV